MFEFFETVLNFIKMLVNGVITFFKVIAIGPVKIATIFSYMPLFLSGVLIAILVCLVIKAVISAL